MTRIKVAFLALACGVMSATTYTAPTCSYTDVSSAVVSAASGDIVVIPSGVCDWAGNSVTIAKAIHLVGSGASSTTIIGKIIYGPTAAEAGKTFELVGLTLDGNYTVGDLFVAGAPDASTPITGLKIHGNSFTHAASHAVLMFGLEFGVYYGNTFTDNNIAIANIGSEMNGWNYAHSAGGPDYPFFEDNTFIQTVVMGGFIVETGRGGRIVFRHNTITGYGGSGGEVWDAHGVTGTYPIDTGTVAAEYYNNSVGLIGFTRVFNHRGGQAIVFNNQITGSTGYMQMTEYQGWSYCTAAAYPKPQQINNSYYWNNSVLPGLGCPSGGCSSCVPSQYDGVYIQLNRDYWLPTSGLDASKPATCTVGDRYGATDTGKLYACSTTNVWTLLYTPYTYPHPLQGVVELPGTTIGPKVTISGTVTIK